MFKRFLTTLLILVATVIWSDSTSKGFTIYLKEKYGATYYVDSVNVIIEKDNNIFVIKQKKLLGIFPLTNWTIVREKM